MGRNYTRDQQIKYKEERRKQASLVADRLLGKKKVDPDPWPAFSGSKMQIPIQYRLGMVTNNPRTSFILSGMNGV